MNLKMKIGISAVTALLMAATAFYSSSVLAVPTHSSVTDYYSDATYTELVGTSVVLCNGQSSLFGIQTQYALEEREVCPYNMKPCGAGCLP